MALTIKSAEDIEGMRRAGHLAASVLDMITPHVQPGATTEHLDQLCHRYITEELGATPAPLDYRGFPKATCMSVNHVVCHGIPGPKKLKKGDILNIDITVISDGWHGDTSRMFCVGEPSILARRLVDVSHECLWRGIGQVRPGATLGDIGHAIQRHAEAHKFSIVREYCGHGIGTQFHEEPQVLHYGEPGTGTRLEPGMTFTVEPMVNAGRAATRVLRDQWTVVTKDRSLSAQWEHTVLVTERGHEILTLGAGEEEPA